MRFRSFYATFGKFERRSADFADGLNIIQAPNEAGKSTLSAFLRVMLYGLSTRERGALADKNLYAPWSGSAMQGRLDLVTDDGRAITLTRETSRAASPMGRFSAIYTGTGESVPDLTAADCGEQLLGVPREVYERSAFIRQSGLAVSADAELERRIAALITTGEEGTSYSEAEAVLRRQLNARKYNKTGRIPALDTEIAALEDTAAELRTLSAEHREAEAALADLTARADELRGALRRHELADAQERSLSLAQARAAMQTAEAEVEQLHLALSVERVPTQETLDRARAGLSALAPLEAAVKRAERARDDAKSALAAFDAAPHAEASRSIPLYIVIIIAALASLLLPRSLPVLLIWGLRLVLIALLGALAVRDDRRLRAARKAHTDAREQLLQALREAEAALSAQRSLRDDAERDLLVLLPITELSQAAACIDNALSRRAALSELEQRALSARVRCEALAAQADGIEAPAEPIERPATPRSALRASLSDCEAELRETRRRIDYTAGRIRALGDLADTEAALSEKRAERETLQGEYDALLLAMDALARANTSLQSRFSPALGRRAAELLGRMTNGAYSSVLLDRSFNASAEPSEEPIARSVLSLSRGTADQLYLAVRLAICDLVLPADISVPLVLDDALTNFDDTRCAAALELLLEESKSRQILLLTCQRREAEYLAGREGVHVMTL